MASSVKKESEIPNRTIAIVGLLVLALLVVGAWFAGRQSGVIQNKELDSELTRLTQQIASTKVQLETERAHREEAEKALNAQGRSSAIDEQAHEHQRVLELQAEAGQYKAIIDRQEHSVEENTRLVRALSAPGAHLFTLKGTGFAAHATAYILVVENATVMLVASGLPNPTGNREYQLWLIRKKEPKTVSAGIFTPDDANRALLEFDERSLVSDISAVEVTDEPRGGSSEPTGEKVLTASIEEGKGQ